MRHAFDMDQERAVCAAMTEAFFFGYGSLVNRRTHVYTPGHRAALRGWRRAWRATDARPAAFLTVVRDPDAVTDGLIAPVPGGDWAALDAREAAYERHDASDHTHHESEASAIAVYAIAPDRMRHASDAHPILLSYLDTVVQGFLAEYGPAGAARFFDATIGWDLPVLDDRGAPRYPRAQPLTDAERMVVDDGLARLSVRVLRGG
jgi:hypothetical protein